MITTPTPPDQSSECRRPHLRYELRVRVDFAALWHLVVDALAADFGAT